MPGVFSVTLDGLTGRPVEVEVDVSGGLPNLIVVGLADTVVREAKNRVRSAVANSGTTWPDQRVTINLAPSTLPKTGAHHDLAMALAVFLAKELVPPAALHGTVFLGELALDGRLRAVHGVLPAVLAAAEAGFTRVHVPEVNVPEARLVAGIEVVGLRSLRQCVALLTNEEEPDDPPVPPLEASSAVSWGGSERLGDLDVADVAGQEDGRTALLVAAVGGHHLLMSGPPGIGKTMLARRLPGLLPDLDQAQSLEVSAIHSLAGMLPSDAPLVQRPPFVDPHHTASAVSVVGGGSGAIKPGAMSVAHRGVLFLDEAPEFASNVLEALRQPLEQGEVVVSRAAQTAIFPARFHLVLATNPCPCGKGGTVASPCDCTPTARRRYRDRISGPIRDRIDVHRELSAPSRPELARALREGRTTRELADAVLAARERQAHRFADTPWTLNGDVPGVELRKRWPLDDEPRHALDRAARAATLSARSVDRVTRLAWSVADLAGHSRPDADDVMLAVALRRGAALTGALREQVAAS